MIRVLLATLLFIVLWGSAHAASTFTNLPAAAQPLGNNNTTGQTYVPLDQGAGCATFTLPCATVQSDALRVGQPIQINCASLSTPWQYQQCIDTSANPPVLKEWIGTTWWSVTTLSPTTGPSITFNGPLTYTYNYNYGSETSPIAVDLATNTVSTYGSTCHIVGNCNANVWTFNDNVLVPSPYTGTTVYQGIQHNIGSASTGNHVTTEWVTLVNGTSTPCCNNTNQSDYGSIFARVTATANLGGIGLGATQVAGQIQAMGLAATTRAGATNLVAVNPLELDVEMPTSSSAYEKVGLLIVQIPGDQVQGATVDTGIQFATAAGAPGWNWGICADCNTNSASIAPTGTWEGSPFTETVTNIFSFGSWNVIGNYIQFKHFLLDGVGQMTLATPSSGSTGPALSVQSNASGTSGGLVQLFNNAVGATTPSKWLAVDSAGNFEILNNAFSASIMTIADNGGVALFGPTNINSTFGVTGNVTLSAGLGVGGSESVTGTLTVTGGALFNGGINSASYQASGTSGVSCGPGLPTNLFQTISGIVIHC